MWAWEASQVSQKAKKIVSTKTKSPSEHRGRPPKNSKMTIPTKTKAKTSIVLNDVSLSFEELCDDFDLGSGR
jgi:hypothetical protein